MLSIGCTHRLNRYYGNKRNLKITIYYPEWGSWITIRSSHRYLRFKTSIMYNGISFVRYVYERALKFIHINGIDPNVSAMVLLQGTINVREATILLSMGASREKFEWGMF